MKLIYAAELHSIVTFEEDYVEECNYSTLIIFESSFLAFCLASILSYYPLVLCVLASEQVNVNLCPLFSWFFHYYLLFIINITIYL